MSPGQRRAPATARQGLALCLAALLVACAPGGVPLSAPPTSPPGRDGGSARQAPAEVPSRPPANPQLAAALALAELYGGLVDDWGALFDRVFEAVSEPKLARNPAFQETFRATTRSYRERLDQLPPTPVSEQVAASERRALELLGEAQRRTAALSDTPSADERSQVVRLMVEAGAAHLAARQSVVDYLQSLGLAPEAFGI